ncbi:glucose-6-phosphate isomerase family protein [Aestuariimicrobium sp. T2.26MG-19.2B]|uniref:glucose-6-phosphate isomerase family protein n=1 Tax=Aestuariimicrobium sp. T2.26MG-19.2B TaxID=3040679 RepID=UPI0024778BD1|nr:glucose-6-phosphate isomerase family protein [Aestuariimicrobium sp. T2.26MG-19.2B]CAI9405815.1 Glucose-6-phosphate isomerase [Aestuariimicrobium sp. T2.26MG-19.2B]
MTITPAPLALALAGLTITGESVVHSRKTLGEVAGAFTDATGVDPDRVLYEVDVFHRGEPAVPGNLYVGMTTIHPGDVNGEFHMTRGHVHQDRRAAEIYVGVAGRGLLLLMDEQGSTRLEVVEPGSIHAIQGSEGHRLVNTGDESLKVFAVWPTTAGYDYAAIDGQGFGVRVTTEGIVTAG